MQQGHDPKLVAKQILWLAREAALTPMQVLKLVYISHGWMLGLHGRPLVDEPVEAWKYGPVVPTVYDAYRSYRGNHITDDPEDRTVDFDESQRDTMQQVWNAYGRYTGIELSSITHRPGTPWDLTRRHFGIGAVIANDLIEDHYRRLASERP